MVPGPCDRITDDRPRSPEYFLPNATCGGANRVRPAGVAGTAYGSRGGSDGLRMAGRVLSPERAAYFSPGRQPRELRGSAKTSENA